MGYFDNQEEEEDDWGDVAYTQPSTAEVKPEEGETDDWSSVSFYEDSTDDWADAVGSTEQPPVGDLYSSEGTGMGQTYDPTESQLDTSIDTSGFDAADQGIQPDDKKLFRSAYQEYDIEAPYSDPIGSAVRGLKKFGARLEWAGAWMNEKVAQTADYLVDSPVTQQFLDYTEREKEFWDRVGQDLNAEGPTGNPAKDPSLLFNPDY